MQTVQMHIDKLQAQFKQHPFFMHLNNANDIHFLKKFTPYIAFWVMVFQDVLRLNEKHFKTRYLHNIARHHRIEDANHDKWFFEDMACLHGNTPYNYAWCFSKQNEITRDSAYAIISETFHLRDEHLRISLLLLLEAYGHVFFENVAQYVEKVGYGNQLKYFSNVHLEVEKAHALYETEMERELFSTVLSEEVRQDAQALARRIDNAMTSMFDSLLAIIKSDTTKGSHTIHDMERELA